MTKKHIFFISFLVFKITFLQAQQKDFQFWPSVQVNVEFYKNFKFHVEEELRLRENSTLISRQINDIGISYRVNSYFKAGLFYRLEADWKNADEYAWRNGLYTDLSFRYDYRRFTLGYRFRGQSAKADLGNKETSVFSEFRHRHKISVAFDIKGIPLTPYSEFELFARTGNQESGISDYRAWIGLEYSIKKKHSFYIQYGIDRELNTPDPLTAYIISIGYKLDVRILKSEE